MTDITFNTKNSGDQFTAAEANEIKAAVNSKAPKENVAFVAGSLNDFQININGTDTPLISNNPIDKTKQVYTAEKCDSLLPVGFTFDSFPEYKTSPHVGSGIAVNGTSVAIWSASSGKWLTAPLADTLANAPTIPNVISATISGEDGKVFTIVFSEEVTRGAGWALTGLTLIGATTGGVNVVSAVSGDGTATHTYNLAKTLTSGEPVTFSWSGLVNGLESSSGGDLAQITNRSVTNNSTAIGVAYLLDERFTGTVAPAGWEPSSGAIFNNAFIANFSEYARSPRFSPQETLYFALQVNFSTLQNTSDSSIMFIKDANDLNIFSIAVRSTKAFRVFSAAPTITGVSNAVTVGDNFLWCKYVNGMEGSNGVLEIRVGSTGVYANSSVKLLLSNIALVGEGTKISIGHTVINTGGVVTFSRLVVSSQPIGDI